MNLRCQLLLLLSATVQIRDLSGSDQSADGQSESDPICGSSLKKLTRSRIESSVDEYSNKYFRL